MIIINRPQSLLSLLSSSLTVVIIHNPIPPCPFIYNISRCVRRGKSSRHRKESRNQASMHCFFIQPASCLQARFYTHARHHVHHGASELRKKASGIVARDGANILSPMRGLSLHVGTSENSWYSEQSPIKPNISTGCKILSLRKSNIRDDVVSEEMHASPNCFRKPKVWDTSAYHSLPERCRRCFAEIMLIMSKIQNCQNCQNCKNCKNFKQLSKILKLQKLPKLQNR